MQHHNLKKIDYWIAAGGVIAIGAATVISGETAFFSTLLGAALGLANWMMFRYVVLRMAVSGNKLGFGVFMGIKSFALMGTITAIFLLLPMKPPAFIAGISSLFLGITSHYLAESLKKGDRILKKENENA